MPPTYSAMLEAERGSPIRHQVIEADSLRAAVTEAENDNPGYYVYNIGEQ